MHRFLVLIISLFVLAACPPAPPAPTPEASTSTAAGYGAGGDAGPADSAATSAEAATTSAATGAPSDGCVGPSKTPISCNTDKECFDGSQCSEDLCDLGTPPTDGSDRKGTCLWKVIPDGSPCDVSDGHDVCRAGACCPPADDAGATTTLPVPASGVK